MARSDAKGKGVSCKWSRRPRGSKVGEKVAVCTLCPAIKLMPNTPCAPFSTYSHSTLASDGRVSAYCLTSVQIRDMMPFELL